MKEIFEQFSTFWKKLGPNQKASILIVTVIAVVALTGITIWAQQPQLVPLLTNATPEDSNAAINYLSTNNIPYEVPGDGSVILVPREKKAATVAALFERGAIKGGSEGFSLLDENKIGLTDLLQTVNVQRAFQGECEKMLGLMSFISKARVVVTEAKDSLYANKELQAKASVILTLKMGANITPAQIVSVTEMVAGCFPGLKPSQVFVTDQNGKPLHTPREENAEASGALLASDRLSYQKEQETYLTHKAQDMLDLAYGPKKTIVRVAVSVKDPPPTTETMESVPPPSGAKGALLSEKKTEKSSTGPSPSTGGPVGVGEKTAEATKPPATSSSPTEKLTEAEKKYGDLPAGKKITRTPSTGFGIEKISVSLYVDKAIVTPPQADKTAAPLPPSQQLIDDIIAQVKKAVGWSDTTRKDDAVTAAVVDLPKDEIPPAPVEGLLSNPHVLEIAQHALEVVVAVLAFFFLKGFVKKSGNKGKTAAAGIPGGLEGSTLPPEVLARIQARRSTEALIAADGEGAGRVTKKWASVQK